MPTAEKFGKARGQVRAVKVFHEFHAHHACHARRDVRIACEIVVHLQSEQHACKEDGKRVRLRHVPEHVVHEDTAKIRYHAFAEKSAEGNLEPCVGILPVELVLRPELRQQMVDALDGACDELGEVADEESVIAEMSLRLVVPSIHVDDVGERLEGVERDAHGKENIQRHRGNMHREQVEQVNHAAEQKLEILKEEKDAETHDEGEDEQKFFDRLILRFFHEDGSQVRDERRSHDQKDEGGVPAHVEIIACRKQNDPSKFMGHEEV